MLDATPLTVQHLLLGLAAFIATTISIIALRNISHPIWRVPGKTSVHFVGIIIAVVATTLAAIYTDDTALSAGLVIATIAAILFGRLDELFNLKPLTQLSAQIVIAVVAVTAGWTIPYVSNPVGDGLLYLNMQTIGPWLIPGSILAAIWLVAIMNSINWLDGSDGLAGSITVIAFGTLAAVSLLPSTQDPQTLALSLIGLGTVAAFLVWNLPKAKVYLGTVGTWYVGLFLGITAIAGGGKIVTTLLVLAIPIIDVALVVIQRLIKRQPIWQKDVVHHVHHHLKSQGLTEVQLVTLAVVVSIFLGTLALLLQTQQKIWAFLIAAAMLGGVISFLSFLQSQNKKHDRGATKSART